jgi:hypothetical protein
MAKKKRARAELLKMDAWLTEQEVAFGKTKENRMQCGLRLGSDAPPRERPFPLQLMGPLSQEIETGHEARLAKAFEALKRGGICFVEKKADAVPKSDTEVSAKIATILGKPKHNLAPYLKDFLGFKRNKIGKVNFWTSGGQWVTFDDE